MSQPTFFEKLWERKVPQFLGTYLAVGFGVLQFIEFISNRFSMSSFWVDSYLLVWLTLLPAIALLLYYRGLPPRGSKKVASWKRWAIYLNVVLVGILVLLLPDADAAVTPETETITTTDESGNNMERLIPTGSSVQRVGIFELENEGNNSEEDWLGTAYSLLLTNGLRQRPELMVSGIRSLNRYYDRYGAVPFTKVNLATQWKIAKRAGTNYFVRAKYTTKDGAYEVLGELYETNSGKKVQTLQAVSDTPFSVVDELKRQIFDFLPPPVIVDNGVTDLPVAALITDNIEALEAYAKGNRQFSQNPGDLPPAIAFFRKSVTADPQCATCLYELADKLYGVGKVDSSILLITKATQLSKMLPEREQFGFRSTYFSVTNNMEAYYNVMEKVRQLYPYEYYPYASLVNHYHRTYGVDSAIVLMEVAAHRSDRELALKQLYGLNISAENYDRAEEIIKDLDHEFAEEEETQRRYALFYQQTGQIGKARSQLKGLIATNPFDLDLTTELVKLEIAAGNYDEGEMLAKDILERAVTRTDSTNGWNYLIRVYSGRGQIREALKELAAYEKHISKDSPINVILNQDINTKVNYALKLTTPLPLIESFFDEVGKYNADRVEIHRCYLNLQFGLSFRELPDMAEKMDACAETIAIYGPAVGQISKIVSFLIDEDYLAAADMITERLENKTEALEPETYLPIFRRAGKIDHALELMKTARLSRPNYPELQLEHARLLLEKGETDKAKVELEGVLSTWEKADPDHLLNLEAEALATELGMEI